jgi:RPA family protein
MKIRVAMIRALDAIRARLARRIDDDRDEAPAVTPAMVITPAARELRASAEVGVLTDTDPMHEDDHLKPLKGSLADRAMLTRARRRSA